MGRVPLPAPAKTPSVCSNAERHGSMTAITEWRLRGLGGRDGEREGPWVCLCPPCSGSSLLPPRCPGVKAITRLLPSPALGLTDALAVRICEGIWSGKREELGPGNRTSRVHRGAGQPAPHSSAAAPPRPAHPLLVQHRFPRAQLYQCTSPTAPPLHRYPILRPWLGCCVSASEDEQCTAALWCLFLFLN